MSAAIMPVRGGLSAPSGLPDRSTHIAAIRGLAIAGVLQCHAFALWHVYDVLSFPKVWIDVLVACGTGVDLFFVLSAFLLTRGLLRQKGQPSFIARFYWRRAARILPAYWLLLILGFSLGAVVSMVGGPMSRWLWGEAYAPGVYLLFLQNWCIGLDGAWHTNFYAHTWSLAVEEQFYLVLPLVAACLSPRRLGLVACGAVLSGVFIRIALGTHISPLAAYCWPLARVDAFGWGILLAIFAHERPDLLRKVPSAALAVGAMSFFAIWAAVVSGKTQGNVVWSAVFLAGTDFLAAALILAAIAAPHGSRLELHPVHRSLAWMGERCYGLYLFHNAFIGLALLWVSLFWPAGGFVGRLLSTIVALVAVFWFSDVVYQRIERPCLAVDMRAFFGSLVARLALWLPKAPRAQF